MEIKEDLMGGMHIHMTNLLQGCTMAIICRVFKTRKSDLLLLCPS